MRSEANREERRLRKLLETYSGIRKQQLPFQKPKTSSPFKPYHNFLDGVRLERGLWPGRATNVSLPHLGKLDRWHKVYFEPSLVEYATLHYCVRGLTIGHPKVSNNQWIITAPVVVYDPGLLQIWTKEGIYQLGEEVIPLPKNIWQKFPLPKNMPKNFGQKREDEI